MSFDAPEILIGTRSWHAGFLDTPEDDTLDDGAITAGRNAWFHKVDTKGGRVRATIGRRPGSRLLTATAVAPGVKCDGLVDFRRDAYPGQLLAKWGGAWYVWNEFNGWTPIATATGYVAGNVGTGAVIKNQAWLTDGAKQQLYDGLTARDPGFVKPTGVSPMAAAGVPVATGQTGTYRAVYTWYDELHNHESSVTDDPTPDLVIVDQGRAHTKPSGAPPAHVTHWRAYVLRVDTGETLYMRTATAPIADATVVENARDRTRRDPAPLTSENDPPTVVFAFTAEYFGHILGFPAGSSDMHVAKQNDPESWHPSHVLQVGAGAGQANRSATRIGTAEIVIQKAGRSYHLVGSRMPFKIDEVSPNFGNVGAESAVTAEGKLFAWDEATGPYWTDLSTWNSLTDARIEKFLRTVSPLDAMDIRAEYWSDASLVVWAVPTIGSPRKRTLLAYHVGIDAWLPPMTGLEYGALRSYLANDGTRRLLMGDHWGRLWSLFEGNRDAPTGGTVAGTVTSATSSTITDSTAAFVTTGSGLVGVPVAVYNPTTAAWVWRRIASNTGTTITLDTANGVGWTAVPAAGWRYIVGGIEWWQRGPASDGGAPLVKKKGQAFSLQIVTSSDDHAIEIRLEFNEHDGTTADVEGTVAAATNAAVWNLAVFNVSQWSATARRARAFRIGRAFYSVRMTIGNNAPDEPIQVTGYSIGADPLRGRGVSRVTT